VLSLNSNDSFVLTSFKRKLEHGVTQTVEYAVYEVTEKESRVED